jgi:hypothetical protein
MRNASNVLLGTGRSSTGVSSNPPCTTFLALEDHECQSVQAIFNALDDEPKTGRQMHVVVQKLISDTITVSYEPFTTPTIDSAPKQPKPKKKLKLRLKHEDADQGSVKVGIYHTSY